MANRSQVTLPERIITALYRKDFKTLKRFLNKETVNLRDKEDGRTLLMLAVGVDDGLELVRFLIENGAEINLADTSGRHTALDFAVIDFQKEVIRLLLKAGANPNAQDASGWTPLHHLVRGPNLKVLLAVDLVRHGADPDLKDASGISPREEAERTDQRDLLQSVVMPKRKTQSKSRGRRTTQLHR